LLYFPLLLTPIRRLTPIDLQGFNKLAPDAAARFGSDAPAARGFLAAISHSVAERGMSLFKVESCEMVSRGAAV